MHELMNDQSGIQFNGWEKATMLLPPISHHMEGKPQPLPSTSPFLLRQESPNPGWQGGSGPSKLAFWVQHGGSETLQMGTTVPVLCPRSSYRFTVGSHLHLEMEVEEAT